MSFNKSDFNKLGFRPKNGEKNLLSASAEVALNQYITIDLDVFGGDVTFAGIEIQGSKANDIRIEYLHNYSIEEIHQLFTDY